MLLSPWRLVGHHVSPLRFYRGTSTTCRRQRPARTCVMVSSCGASWRSSVSFSPLMRPLPSGKRELALLVQDGQVLQAGKGISLELAHPLPANAQAFSDLSQRAGLLPVQAVVRPNDMPIPVILQPIEEVIQQRKVFLVLQELVRQGLGGIFGREDVD